MNKVILKTALGAVASLALAALLVFSLWILISPQTMATSCEKTGNYSFAVTCADLRYKYTGELEDLARCAQDSVYAKKDDLIVKYGEKLVSDEGFESLCEKRDRDMAQTAYGEYAAGYKRFICGNLAAAQYRTGSLDKAVETAVKGGTFAKLVIEIIENGTKTDGEKVLNALKESESSDENLTKLLEEFINKGD